MAARETSAAVYHGEIEGARELSDCALIAQLVRARGPMTRREIAGYLHMETSSVAGRVNELVSTGVLVESDEIAPCPITGRRVHWLQHKDSLPGGQLRLV